MTIKIYVDPGHGGHDPGAVDGKGTGDNLYTEEEDLNLPIGLFIRDGLIRNGFAVRMSRVADTFPTLGQRVSEANAWGANAFISVHNNAASPSAKGIEILYHSGSAAGKSLGNAIMKYVSKVSPWPDMTVRPDVRGLYVLRATNMPAVIVEYGFVTNVEEEKLLNQKAYQQELAEATVQGLCEKFGKNYIPLNTPTPQPTPAPTPKPTPAPTAAPLCHNVAGMPLLKEGSNGTAVVHLQKDLNRLGKYGLVADGDFGPKTEAAVKDFQNKKNLTADGVVGPKTWTALLGGSVTPPAPTPAPTPAPLCHKVANMQTVKRGSQGQDVVHLQKDLNKKGYGLSIDGDFGPRTETAVKHFQQRKGLVADGIVGPKTWTALL